MSNDNIIPIRSADEHQPPQPTRGGGKTRKRKPDLAFLSPRDGSQHPYQAFLGLKGVCNALYELHGASDDLDRYVQLSSAAVVLVELLQQMEDTRP
jgi:hypothetical protein